jgi:hypothetical protein
MGKVVEKRALYTSLALALHYLLPTRADNK